MTTATIPNARPQFQDRDADNLYAAILDEPWRMELRGVLCDRLEEIGQSDLAELVRCQLELAKLGSPHKEIETWAEHCGDNYYMAEVPNYEPPQIGDRIDTGMTTKRHRQQFGLLVKKVEPVGTDGYHVRLLLLDDGKGKYPKRRADFLRSRIAALLAAHPEWYAGLVAALPKCQFYPGEQCDTACVCHGSGLAVAWEPGPVWPDVRLTCTLRQFMRERCGRRVVPALRLSSGTVHAECSLLITCPECSGCGYTGGLALLAAEWPVEWVLGDKQPNGSGGRQAVWVRAEHEGRRRYEETTEQLPPIVFDLLTGFERHIPIRPNLLGTKSYPTAPAANAALSAACGKLARSWAGLPAWPAKE